MKSESELKSQIAELLKQQLQGFRCLVCHRDEFAALDLLEQGLQSNVMLYSGGDPVAKKHAPLLTIACTHCGRIEQFAEMPLRLRLLAESDADS
jgi:hypothetical protein